MTTPAAPDFTRAAETLAAVYRLLADIGRRHREPKPDDTKEEQPDDKRAA